MGSGNLTINRASSSGYSSNSLNLTYERVLAQMGILSASLIDNDGSLIDTNLDEGDEWSAGIETPDDIAALIAWLGMNYNIVESDFAGGNLSASWLGGFTFVGEVYESTITVYDYMENQFASGVGLNLNLIEQGYSPPRQQAEMWIDTSTRLSDLLKDQAMFYGNQYIQAGAVYNTARTGSSIPLSTALRNANNMTYASNLQGIASGRTTQLAVTNKLLPFASRQQNMLISGAGGNLQDIPALSGGNASPFATLKGFSPSFASSLSPANYSTQQLSHEGNQQQISFNTLSSKDPFIDY